ncbi:MAG: hypothetical protein C5B54_06105 [Acidobacteria bacterium]|nr:MAG: hypothetical protein C5B54_06105 [Acidobacteriota bacterium]
MLKKWLAFLICIFCFTLPAVAQQDQEVTVEDIFKIVREGNVITSTKTERPLKLAPFAVSVVTRQQIQESGATTLSEALRIVPGINARTTAMGTEVGIRSFGSTPFSERVLFLIDGTPYNSPDKGGYPGHPSFEDFFPLEAVKRIEVIKGPGSALYGQNAFFGIINIITDDFKGTNNAMFNGGSRGTADGVVRGGGGKGDWTYTYLGKFKTQDGPLRYLEVTDPNAGNPANSPQDVKAGKADVKSGDAYFKASNQTYSFSYTFHRDTTDSFNWFKPRKPTNLPGAPTDPALSDGGPCCITFPTEQTLQFVDFNYKRPVNDRDNFQFKAFYNRRDGNTCANCHFNSFGPDVVNHDETNQRFFLNGQYQMIRASHKVIFGIDGQFDNTSKDIEELANVDKSINTVAGYVQDEITLLDDRMIATLGARVDQNGETGTSFSPSVSAVFKASDKLIFRSLYGRAFRQPTWNDLFTRTDYGPVSPNPTEFALTGLASFQQVGNPNTDTEKIDTIEGGAEYFFDENTSFKFDAYYNHVTDLIEAYDFIRSPLPFAVCVAPNAPPECNVQIVPPSFTATTKNLPGSLNSAGFEIEFRVKPVRQLSAIVGYAYQHDDFEKIGGTFENAYSPKHKITAAVNVNPVEPLFFNLSLNYWSDYNTRTFLAGSVCAACTNTSPIGQSYTYADIKALYKIPIGDKRLGLGFTVKNLFNEQVELSHAFRVDASLYGREYFGSIEAEF